MAKQLKIYSPQGSYIVELPLEVELSIEVAIVESGQEPELVRRFRFIPIDDLDILYSVANDGDTQDLS